VTARHSPASRRATAYHEAGHVVAAWHFGLSIYCATIIPKGDMAGSMEHGSPLRGIRLDIDRSDRARVRAEKNVIVILAGPEAQRRHNPHSWRKWHAHSDYVAAADIALHFNSSADAADAHLNWLALQTRDIVSLRWHEIELVAAQLLERGAITGHEAKRTISHLHHGRDMPVRRAVYTC
jgi:hypothetical protein